MKVFLLLLSILSLSGCYALQSEQQLQSSKLSCSHTALLESKLADGRRVTVIKGKMEPESIGSYSIRLYAANPDFPYDDFVWGAVHERDGVLVNIKPIKTKQGQSKVMVIMRSAGSGGYFITDVYQISDDKLKFIQRVQ